jgi:hypothetical protein
VADLYLFDTNTFRVLGGYYPETFGSFWENIDKAVSAGLIASVREVKKEMDNQDTSEHVMTWAGANAHLFAPPTEDDMRAVAEILSVPHFTQLIGEKQRLKGMPVADPFLIARGKVESACVVTEEKLKQNAAKVPNVCHHFGVECTNLQGFLREQGWRF